MIPFKDAIKKWEEPLNEKMIGYSALTRKASINPGKIFVILYWVENKRGVQYKEFDVGLKKVDSRWVVDSNKFKMALIEKIKEVENSNRLGKTRIDIKYPDWLSD